MSFPEATAKEFSRIANVLFNSATEKLLLASTFIGRGHSDLCGFVRVGGPSNV